MSALFRKLSHVAFVLLFLSFLIVPASFAQNLGQLTPTPGPGIPNLTTCAGSKPDWRPDAEVTEVGKGADRARQFLYWIFSKEHQSIDNAPVLTQMWAVSRNIVYIFVVLVIVAFGFSYIFLRRRAMSIDIPPILIKVGAVLLYATFSYVLVLGLIQGGEILMRFFIEKVGGQDLFNVIFAGVNSEKNYINFIGYRDMSTSGCAMESANTSLFLIRMTSLTYNTIGILMILRKIILWFLLILSPFLAILMPFVFIRNIGWIWIGVFFQWLFYGPMVSLFLAALTRIWVAGIPYAFDFNRVNTPDGQIFRTSINILYGGPAQTLGPGNSANYVDTYVEYVIALVMLWAAIILPWLLLRIFRDYCCSAIASAGNTLNAIFDRMRQYPPPEKPSPSASGPTTMSGMAMDLPFRQAVSQAITSSQKETTKQVTSQLASTMSSQMTNMAGQLGKVATNDIASKLNMSISNIVDLSRLEMDQSKLSDLRASLSKISNPSAITNSSERAQFSSIRSELVTRAATGDHTAQGILSASSSDQKEQIVAIPTVSSSRMANQAQVVGAGKVTTVKTIPIAGKVVSSSVSLEDYEEVKKMWLNHYRESPVPVSEKIKERSQWVEGDITALTNAIHLLSSADAKQREKGLEMVSQLLPFLLMGGFSEVETITYLRAKLEAAKQSQAELEARAKAKEELEKEKKEDEELVEVDQSAKKEDEKTMQMHEEKAQELPGEEASKPEVSEPNLPKTDEKV